MSIPVLMFAEGGWCDAIKDSYRPGPHQPRTIEEFKALAPFAVNAPALDEPESDAPDEPAKGKPGRKPKARE